VANQKRKDSEKTRYKGLEKRLPHKLWQSLQKIATTRYSLRIIALRIKKEGIFLVCARGLTVKSSDDNKVVNSHN
jgi:hypothetical protein